MLRLLLSHAIFVQLRTFHFLCVEYSFSMDYKEEGRKVVDLGAVDVEPPVADEVLLVEQGPVGAQEAVLQQPEGPIWTIEKFCHMHGKIWNLFLCTYVYNYVFEFFNRYSYGG